MSAIVYWERRDAAAADPTEEVAECPDCEGFGLADLSAVGDDGVRPDCAGCDGTGGFLDGDGYPMTVADVLRVSLAAARLEGIALPPAVAAWLGRAVESAGV